MPSTSDPRQDHTPAWDSRLQDYLDGDLAPAENVSIERHVAECGACQEQVREHQRLDQALRLAAPPIALDASFDRRLIAQIDAYDDAQQSAARRRAERELHENLRALTRAWRRTLAFIVPGAIAGVALALVLSSYLASAGFPDVLAQAVERLSYNDAGMIDLVVKTGIGAAIGASLARWLAVIAE